MFGESDTGESPRVASPWEALISTPPSPKYVPKLVPEAEEGNVEYKLQLLSPSPARFARLVTQLKWRLLEGGGQAYYELGVADSGALVGLRRAELERTLGTLECMAGEIGASVVVVREIEVPKGMSVGKKWGDSEPESTTTEDGDEVDVSPSPLTLDTSPALFPMDPEVEEPTLDIEISTVYKPRPIRLSPTSFAPSKSSSHSLPAPAKQKWFPKKHCTPSPTQDQPPSLDYPKQTKQQAKALHRRLARDKRREEKRRALALPPEFTSSSKTKYGSRSDSSTSTSNSNSTSASTTSKSTPSPNPGTQPHIDPKTTARLVSGLHSLHVTIDSNLTASIPAPLPVSSVLNGGGQESDEEGPTVPTIDITSPTSPISLTSPTSPNGLTNSHGLSPANQLPKVQQAEEDEEVRLIVEALVVRKLSLEEAYLDFGGFSLF